MKKVAEDLLTSDGIMSSRVHVGNSDIVGEFVYEDSEQLVYLAFILTADKNKILSLLTGNFFPAIMLPSTFER